MSTPIRLNKHIADLGICSRRKADELITSGKVKVNSTTVTDLGTKVTPGVDRVDVAGMGNTPPPHTGPIYIALNKPIDYISSTTNEQGASILDLISREHYYKQKYADDAKKIDGVRLFPVGRLDKDSEGLILLTNDGELTNELTHPRYEHEKEYDVTVDKALTKDARIILEKGMFVDDDWYGGMKIKKEFNKGRRVILTVVLTEGKNRHIRKMLGSIGLSVFVLRRTRINKLSLGTLPVGKWKFVEKSDIVDA